MTLNQGSPKGIGAILVSWVAKICIEAKGMGAKYKVFGDEFILDILKLRIKSKKKVLGINISIFETYTRYFGVID